MSSPSPLSNEPLARSSPEADAQHVARWGRFAGSVKEPLQFVCFWGAIALPVVHLGLLAHGIESLDVMIAFLGLLAINLLALYVGHGYNQG